MPICDCEVFEICPSCAPDEPTYAKAAVASDEAARRSEPSSKSYTVEEIKSLARVFATEIYAGSDVDFHCGAVESEYIPRMAGQAEWAEAGACGSDDEPTAL